MRSLDKNCRKRFTEHQQNMLEEAKAAGFRYFLLSGDFNSIDSAFCRTLAEARRKYESLYAGRYQGEPLFRTQGSLTRKKPEIIKL